MTSQSPPDLIGSHVRLRVMRDDDAPALVRAAADGELWTLKVTAVPSEATVAAYMKTALDGAKAGTVIPYVIETIATGEPIGSTRFWRLDRANRTVEIGHTWISASYQRTAVNTEMKLLMLTHAFETLSCVRVQFQTDELNAKSRAAIARLGAKEEGILRNERIMPDGRIRNTVMFSILDSEWPDVKSKLSARLAG
ncbi:GNAT family N-acetyltransferase [[Pseudomonas] carboxydohydrogena]|uniref:GNAT family N-acetyltransferase n=1 Tax=Afipia carboxydohydrogena TaxID=290 RepID=A0ABY8BVS8_AFICR|nr:GNAT family protein [[Pseudomonas] carboxydohydrogena]WEF52755.1 GNAT family N-acetyltransferase [[Pseudomonas] carboxydohydrogena]